MDNRHVLHFATVFPPSVIFQRKIAFIFFATDGSWAICCLIASNTISHGRVGALSGPCQIRSNILVPPVGRIYASTSHISYRIWINVGWWAQNVITSWSPADVWDVWRSTYAPVKHICPVSATCKEIKISRPTPDNAQLNGLFTIFAEKIKPQ